MEFDNGITAKADTAIMKNMDNNAIIEGTDGKIIIDLHGCQEEMAVHITQI